MKDIYYNLDGQNIFKRVHRYRHKIIFLVVFLYLAFMNLFDFGFNIYLIIDKPDYNIEGDANRKALLLFNMIYIMLVLILTTFTNVKLEIQTKIYY